MKVNLLRASALAMLLALGACAASGSAVPPEGGDGGGASDSGAASAAIAKPGATAPSVATSPLTRLSTFTVTDLQAALADATAHQDVIAMACYPALIKFVQAQGGTSAPTLLGAFTAFQLARDGVKTLKGGLPTYLVLGCAPLVQDATGDAVSFVAKLAALAPFAP